MGLRGLKVPEAQGFFDWRQLRSGKLTDMAFFLKANQKSCWHAATCRSDLREDVVRNSFHEKKRTLHKNTRRTWPKNIQHKPIACTQKAILCPLSCPVYEVDVREKKKWGHVKVIRGISFLKSVPFCRGRLERLLPQNWLLSFSFSSLFSPS